MADVLDTVNFTAATVRSGVLLGEIYGVIYFYPGLDQWYQIWGAPGGYPIGVIPSVAIGTQITYAFLCNNLSTVVMKGSIVVRLTKPVGSVAVPLFLDDFLIAQPQAPWDAFMCNITLDKAGIYEIEADLEGEAA